MHYDFLIVGAGISGLSAARILAESQPLANIAIIDKAPVPGGLLQSSVFDGHSFDLGTHIPELSQNDHLNSLIFPSNTSLDWHRLLKLNVANFYNGELNTQSQFLNITHDEELLKSALVELIELPTSSDKFTDLHDQLLNTYGEHITQSVFEPIIAKMTDYPLAELSVNNHFFYGLSRIVVGNLLASIRLKSLPHLETPLAYAEDDYHPRQSTWAYPNFGQGVGAWQEFIHKEIKCAGVDCLFNTEIESIQAGKAGYELALKQQPEVITASKVIWTLPFYSGLGNDDALSFKSRPMSIFHLISDKAALINHHYLYCFDSSLKSYRITFYDNLQPDGKKDTYRVSVEMVLNPEDTSEEEIIEELKKMHLFSSDANLTLVGKNHLMHGFPILTQNDVEARVAQFENIRQTHPDMVFVGRGKPHIFFMTDVLQDVYDTLKNFKGVSQ